MKENDKIIDIYKTLTFIDEQTLMHLWLNDLMWYKAYTSISAIYKKYSDHSKKNGNKNNKKHFQWNESCRDVKTQKACEQG